MRRACSLLCLLLAGQADGPRVLFVATDGNDAGPGTLQAPFATLERARDEIRRRKAAEAWPAGGFEVRLRAGTYRRSEAFRLGAGDSGRAGAPVLYRSHEGEEVRISGGRELRAAAFKPSADPRLDPAARGKVLQADLRAEGLADFGRLKARGFGLPQATAALELTFQDKPLPPAQWPNRGWARIRSAPAGAKGDRFVAEEERPARWRGEEDVWVHGYWTWDWADSYAAVASIDAATGAIVTAAPHGTYGYKAGKRFRAIHVLQELDEPGEWHLDRKTGLLSLWPPGPLEGGRLEASVLEEPLVAMTEASHVGLKGFILEAGRSHGVTVRGGEQCRIAGCVLRNLGNDGVRLQGGRGHAVVSCDITGVGETGIVLEGGDRRTLVPGGHQALNNHIYEYSRWCRTYRPAVLVSGVGHRVAHCRIHDAPHNAILFGGNDHVLELNEVYRVCRETGDAGAFYIGRDWTMRGNVVRHNIFRDLEGVKGEHGFTEVMGVYLDDAASGTRVEGNLFQRVSRAVMVGGGRDNAVEHNLLLDCPVGIHVDARGVGWAKKHIALEDGDWGMKAKLEAMNWKAPPYSERYPGLAGMLDDEPYLPKGTSVKGNVASGCAKWLLLLDRLTPAAAGVKENFAEGDPGFETPAGPDYRLKADAPAAKAGFPPIPFDRIGLMPDADRRSLPPR